MEASERLVQCPLSPFNYVCQALASPLDLSEDFLSFGFPDVSLRRQVAFVQIAEDRVLQFLHAGETAGQHNLLAEVAEEALYQIQPGTAGWGEMEMKAGMLF